MASGSSGRNASGSKVFNFGSDDIFSQYDDFESPEIPNGRRTESNTGSGSGIDPRESRGGRSSADVYNSQEERFSQELIATVEKSMKKYTENLLRYLEGISGRLSQLELYCYNLEKSIGELRSDLTDDHGEVDLKLRSLEKHLQEVHRSVQILRDKQELSDAQKELAKLQLAKDATFKSHSQQKDDGVASTSVEPKKHEDNALDPQNLQLALALPPARPAEPLYAPYKELPPQQTVHVQQPAPLSVPPQQCSHVQQALLTAVPPQQTIQALAQPNAYYSQQTQLPNQPAQTQQLLHEQQLQAELQYGPQRSQLQDLSRQMPHPQPQVSQAQNQSFPSYQQQWPQPASQQLPQPQVPSSNAQGRPQTPPAYPPYSHQLTSSSPETFPGSMPMQVTFSVVPTSGASHPEPGVYGYGGPGSRTVPPQALQHNMQQPQPRTNQSSLRPNLGDGGYPAAVSHPPQSSILGYMIYDADGSRSQPPHFQQGSYPPTHLQNQQAPPSSVVARYPNSQILRNHPYIEMIEKAASMGYPRDQVANVIRRMEESGRPVDFNSLLDRLNAQY